MNERYHVPGLLRGLEVIEYLAGCGREGAMLTELTAALSISKRLGYRTE